MAYTLGDRGRPVPEFYSPALGPFGSLPPQPERTEDGSHDADSQVELGPLHRPETDEGETADEQESPQYRPECPVHGNRAMVGVAGSGY